MIGDNPTKKADRQYLIEFTLSMLLYTGVLVGSIWIIERFGLTGWARIAIVLLPMLPVGLLFASVVRYFQRSDELTRTITTISLALSGGLTAMLAVTYGFLEGVGLPKLSAWWTYVTFMGLWLIMQQFVARRYR